jgi:G:T/U-mismatch repair DNA glycosylase
MTVLPDYLDHGLRVAFCGTAVGETSAACVHYYAGPGNAFWQFLYDSGLTSRRLAPHRRCVDHEIGDRADRPRERHRGVERSSPSEQVRRVALHRTD